eukprot:2769334-Amphidinium_carterae.1
MHTPVGSPFQSNLFPQTGGGLASSFPYKTHAITTTGTDKTKIHRGGKRQHRRSNHVQSHEIVENAIVCD